MRVFVFPEVQLLNYVSRSDMVQILLYAFQVHNEQINDLLDPSQRNLQVYSNLEQETNSAFGVCLWIAVNLSNSVILDKRECWQWYPC